LNKDAGSELGSIWLFEEPETEAFFHKTRGRDVEAVKFLWKRKHFEERSWKRGSGSTLKKEAGSGSELGSD